MTDRRKQALIEMAKRGTAEERKIAEDVIERSGISIEDETIINSEFHYKGKFERNLLFQIHSMIVNSISASYYFSKKKRNTIWFDLTKSQELELKLHYSIYRRELKEELEVTYSAFVQQNQIFAQSNIDSPNEPEDVNKLRKILNRAETIDKTHIRKQLS